MAKISTNLGYEPEKNKHNIAVEKQIDEPTSTPVDDEQKLQHIISHVTAQDMQPAGDKYAETGDEIYDKFSRNRKIIMTAVLSFCGSLSPISSTAVLAAIPEVAKTYNSSGTIINLSNALYLVFMGLSPVFWGPLGQVYGRRIVRFTALLRSNNFQTNTRLLDANLCRRTFLRLLDRHSFGSKPGFILCLPYLDCFPRDSLLDRWRKLYRRYLSTCK